MVDNGFLIKASFRAENPYLSFFSRLAKVE